jgi:hypothetical protein
MPGAGVVCSLAFGLRGSTVSGRARGGLGNGLEFLKRLAILVFPGKEPVG